jgi:drug/metabolite transporter (DMT)-like permease
MLGSVILGLLSAVSWGVADFLARQTSREIGAYRSLFFMQAFGFGLLSTYWLATGGSGRAVVTGTGWGWGLFAGVLSAVASLALYRAFEMGVLAVVAPISASYPALTALLAMESGERVGPGRWTGIVLILVGVALAVSAAGSGASLGPEERRKARVAVGMAVAAAVGFGVMFWLLGFRVVPALGGLMSVWMVRLVGVVALGVAAWPARESLRLPAKGTCWVLVAMGILDTGAYLSNNFGMELKHVSVVTVLASLYAAVTVLLAAAVLREKLTMKQWLGVALIFAGIVALAM